MNRSAGFRAALRSLGAVLAGLAVLLLVAAAEGQPARDVAALLDEIRVLEDRDPPVAEARAEAILAAAETPLERAGALVELAALQQLRGAYADALARLRESRAEQPDGTEVRLDARRSFVEGVVRRAVSDLPAARYALEDASRWATEAGDDATVAEAQRMLATVLVELGRNDLAAAHLDEAGRAAERAGDPEVLTAVINGRGNLHLAEGDLVRARASYEEALARRRALGNPRAIADSLGNLGIVTMRQGDPERALAMVREAGAIYDELRLPRHRLGTLRHEGAALRALGRLDESLAVLERAVGLATDLGAPGARYRAYRELALTHEARGSFAAALAAERRYMADLEAMRTERARQMGAEIEARLGVERREREIARLREAEIRRAAELAEQRRRSTLAFAAAAVVLVAFAAAVAVQRARLRREAHLREATEEARRRAEEAGRLQERLRRMVVHDLKVPLAALESAARGVLDAPGLPSGLAGRVEAIRADAAYLRDLARRLLSETSPGAPADGVAADLAAEVAAAGERLGPLAAERGRALRAEPAGGPVRAHADPARLHQILDNLVGNALEVTPAGGYVTLSVGLDAHGAWIEVADQGPGLPASAAAVLFAPHGTPAPAGGAGTGRGFGLSIVRDLVADQGGSLGLDVRPGGGTAIRIVLPAAAERAPG